jgi:exonuclease III
MVMEFDTELHRAAALGGIRRNCKELGIKAAVVARKWTTREANRAHRTQLSDHSAKLGRPANEYEALECEAEEDYIALPDESGPTPSDKSCPPQLPKGKKQGNFTVRSLTGRKAGGKRAKAKAGSKRFEREQKKAKLGDELCRTTIRVGSFNAQGGVVNGIGELEDYARRHSFDILAVQETRLQHDTKLSSKGYKVYRQPADLEEPQKGVLFLVANALAAGVAVEPSTRGDQLWIRLTGTDGRKDIVFCAAYMPQESATALERTTAFSILQTRAAEFGVDCEVVILGDLNAKACSAATEEERTLLGIHCEPGKRTANGRLLVKLMKGANMISLAGHYAPSAGPAAAAGYWWSRSDPVTGAKHAIDYILVTNALRDKDSSFWVDYTDLDSDHQLLGAQLRCPRRLGETSHQPRRRRYKTELFIQRSSSREAVELAQKYKDEYARQSEKALEDFAPRLSCSSKCDCIGPCACRGVGEFVHRAIIALENSVGSVPVGRQFNRSWFDEEVRTAITSRRKIHAEGIREGFTKAKWLSYRRARRKVRRMVQAKKSADWKVFEQDLETAYSSDHRRLWQLISRLVPSGKKAVLEPVQRADGTLAKSEEHIADTWGDYTEKLGRPEVDQFDNAAFTKQVESQMKAAAILSPTLKETPLDEPFSLEELEVSLKKLQYHKATTSDDTSGEMLIFGGVAFRQHLLNLFNWLVKTEAVPAAWQSATIINLFKEGDRTDPKNYRGIALISCIGKLYFSLWANRLALRGETGLQEEQGGFRRWRSTVDQALVLREILTQRKAAGKTTYLCFVDFRKAFDTVWHTGLWKRLWDSNIRGKPWRIIQNLYSSIRAKVRLGNVTSREVKMQQGVRQGCPLSPTLFNFFVDELVTLLRKKNCGIQHEGIDIGSLLYADDVVLMADSPEALQGLIDVVDDFCRNWKMSMNMEKSKVMVVRAKKVKVAAHTWKGRDKTLEVVHSYKYLGVWFSDDLMWKVHFRVILDKVQKRTAGLSKVIRNKNIPLRAKTLVWLARVRPLLEYGSEVWQANATQYLAMERSLLRAGKQMLRVNAHTHSEAVLALLHVPKLHHRHEQARLKYVAKLMAMDKSRLARVVLMRSRTTTWWLDSMKIINKYPELQKGFAQLQRSSERNHGVLPRGIDPMTEGDYDYYPLDAWNKKVEEWILSLTLSNFRKNRATSLTLLQRAVADDASEEAGEEIVRMPRYPLTRCANRGPNQIRLRLLCGTSGLNATLTKYGKSTKSSSCPFGFCDGGAEDALHFLLKCKGYEKLRTHFRSELDRYCHCDRNVDDVEPCAEFFENLDDVGKALFMLQGPVKGRTPESSIDACSLRFVRNAWKIRCDTLTAQNPDKSEIDLSVTLDGSARGSESSGSPRGGGALAPIAAPTGRKGPTPPRCSDTAQQSITALFLRSEEATSLRSRIAQLTTTTTTASSAVSRRHNGSGPNVLLNMGSG